MKPHDIPQVSTMSIPEKILFLEDLWDSITADESEVSVPCSHKEELDRRLERHVRAPGNLLSLEELQARVERRK